MKATSLSVNLPGGCDAYCPFCISKLTGGNDTKTDGIRKGLGNAFRYASHHGVDTVLITGKGEPTLHYNFVKIIIQSARDQYNFPAIEMQTNGYELWKDIEKYGQSSKLKHLMNSGLTTVAISIANFKPLLNNQLIGLPKDYNYLTLVKEVSELGLLCRISLNMNNGSNSLKVKRVREGAELIKKHGAHQLTLRELGVPNEYNEKNKKQRGIVKWIENNTLSNHQLQEIMREVQNENRILRTVSYGPSVYDYHGLSTVVATCMTDNTDPEEIRSLILQPNGHLYHSWNFEGSILL